MTAQASHANEGGFSLIELLVAMVITLIVSGAIYGLLAGGQNAFRREPELTERQQNIRMAMDVIMRDISNAGAGLPPFVQVFSPGLDACVSCGSAAGPTGAVRDELEMLSSSGRDTEPTCYVTGTGNGTGTTLSMVRQGQAIPANTMVALIFANNSWTMRKLSSASNPVSTATMTTVCTGTHTLLTFTPPDGAPIINQPTLCGPSNGAVLPAMGNAPGVGTCETTPVTAVAFPRLIRYRIRDDSDGVPMLERMSSEDFAFQTIARGIEDLQVQYTTLQDATVWVDDAPLVPLPVDTTPIGNWDDLTQQVRVTLTARSEAVNIQGAMNDANAVARIRGSLTSTGTPRAILMHVAAAHPGSPYPASPSSWYWE